MLSLGILPGEFTGQSIAHHQNAVAHGDDFGVSMKRESVPDPPVHG